MDSTSTTDAPPTVSSVDCKLPPFRTADPALWFIQVESQFAARRITADLTKYHYVVSSLPSAIASEMRDLLLAPPVENACICNAKRNPYSPSYAHRTTTTAAIASRHGTRRPYS
ncbi:hypothetical protein MRX96_024604 [Rhipicephalus microplus]